jgi:hypothetical protein
LEGVTPRHTWEGRIIVSGFEKNDLSRIEGKKSRNQVVLYLYTLHSLHTVLFRQYQTNSRNTSDVPPRVLGNYSIAKVSYVFRRTSADIQLPCIWQTQQNRPTCEYDCKMFEKRRGDTCVRVPSVLVFKHKTIMTKKGEEKRRRRSLYPLFYAH